MIKKDTKKDFRRDKAMLAYGFIQLGSTIVSAVALVAIVLKFFIKKKNQISLMNVLKKSKLLIRQQLILFVSVLVVN